MNIIHFFTIVAALLSAVLVFFRPMEVTSPTDEEIAQLELDGFVLYELTTEGLKTTLSGSSGKRFEDRYEADTISFTDTSKGFRQNMVADHGVYRNNTVDLEGNVTYLRDDGLLFESDRASFDQNRSTVTTPDAFRISLGRDWVTGDTLVYRTEEGRINAHNIEGNYLLIQ